MKSMTVCRPVKAGIALYALAVLFLACSCTERRKATDPVADGDTIEVTIPGAKKLQSQRPVRIIEVEEETADDNTNLGEAP